MQTTPRASSAAADAIQSSCSRSSSWALRSRSTKDTTDAISAAATSIQPIVRSGKEMALLPKSSPTTTSLGWIVSVPRVCSVRPAAASEHDPAPASRQQATVGCGEEDDDLGGEGRPAHQRSRPGGDVSPVRGTGAVPVQHPGAVGIGRQGHREQTGREHQPAESMAWIARDDECPHHGVAQSGQRSEWPPMVRPGRLAQERAVRRGEHRVQDERDRRQCDDGPGDAKAHLSRPGPPRVRRR